MATAKPAPVTSPASSYPAALVVMTTLFLMWGFLTELNDVLVPHLESKFDLNYFQAMADRIGIHYSFVLPAPCYLYILYYAVRRSKPAGAV